MKPRAFIWDDNDRVAFAAALAKALLVPTFRFFQRITSRPKGQSFSQKECGRVENPWKPLRSCVWNLKPITCWGTASRLENQWSSWRLIGWVPFIKYIYIYMDYTYIYLQPKWPLFPLEKALFWGADLEKWRSIWVPGIYIYMRFSRNVVSGVVW